MKIKVTQLYWSQNVSIIIQHLKVISLESNRMQGNLKLHIIYKSKARQEQLLSSSKTSGGISERTSSMRLRTTLHIFNSNVKSILLYGCETWRTTQMMQQKIQISFNTCLRRIYKLKWQEKIQNEDLWERAGQEPVAIQILQRKWGWIGHTIRKPASSTTCQALTWNPQAKRKRDRPRSSWTWRQDTEAEVKQHGTNWSGMARTAQNRWPMLHRERWT